MLIFEIENDRCYSKGETDRLGWEYDPKVQPIELDPEGHFPFTRFCFSIGDWGIISALPQILKTKYPKLTFSIPSREWIKNFVGNGTWSFNGSDIADNVELICANNPYIDFRFQPGQYTHIIGDHQRCYRYLYEPLIEQIMRAWGFTEDEILNTDTRPQLYFTEEEKQIGDSIISKYTGFGSYGCVLLAARLEKFNKRWPKDTEHAIWKQANKFKMHPVFYYNSFDIGDWKTKFAEWISFKDIPEATMRIQMYIKQQAVFNLGYQSGIGDSCTGTSRHYIATPYEHLTETVVRGSNVTYYFSDGRQVCYAR